MISCFSKKRSLIYLVTRVFSSLDLRPSLKETKPKAIKGSQTFN